MLTILLSLFLALSKRRHELVLLAQGATGHRRILQEYSPYLRLRGAVDHERCAGQRLEGCCDRAVRIEVVRPSCAAAQCQHRIV